MKKMNMFLLWSVPFKQFGSDSDSHYMQYHIKIHQINDKQKLAKVIIYWLNSFPSKIGVFRTMSFETIVQGRSKPDMIKERISFGSYVVVYTKK